jgi:hypothetical protein
MRYVAIVLAATALFALACGSSTPAAPEPTSTPQSKAWYACTLSVDKQLGLSYLNDAERFNPAGVTTLDTNLYRVRVRYADQGSTYQCVLELLDNGDMRLRSLDEVR